MASENRKRKFSTEYTLISSPVLQNLKQQLEKTIPKTEECQPSVVIQQIIQKPTKKNGKKLILDEQLYAKEKLKKYAELTPEGQLDKKTEKRIRKQLPVKLSEQFPLIVNSQFKNVQEQYGIFIKNIASEQKIKSVAHQELLDDQFFIDKINKRQKQSVLEKSEFIERKLYLEQRLFITTPFLRLINYKSQTEYLDTLFDFNSYRDNSKSIQIAVLRARIREDLESSKSATIHELCKYTNHILSTKKTPKTIPKTSELFITYIKCVEHFLSLKIMESLYRTVQHFIQILSKPDKIPLIKFHITVDTELELLPNFLQLNQFYHNLIELIGCHEIELRNFRTTNLEIIKLKIEIPAYLSEWAHTQIDKYLKKLYEPVQDHMNYLSKIYSNFWNEDYIVELKSFYKTHTFQECCDKFNELKQFHRKLVELFPYVYLQIGILEQTEFIEIINRKISRCIENLLDSLVQNNYAINRKLCQEFSTISKRASKVPETTAELVDLHTFMLQAKNELINQLLTNVKESMLQTIELLDMTHITAEHIQLNSKTIVWTRRIGRVLEKYTIMYEQRKNELEEELQRQIDDLTKNVQIFANSLQILDDMSDVSKTNQYLYHLKQLQMKMEIFDVKQNWINNEESLFKFPPSTFADLEDAKNIIFTFANLVIQCHHWLRTHSVYMDGPWENITYENVDENVNKYKTEFLKYQKLYNTKIRQQITDGITRRFKGMVDDPDFHNHPAPLKLITNAMKLLKEFEPHVEIVRILCNPALLQRHWDEIAAVLGRNITPNAGTTLRKVTEENLGPYLEQFEIISIAAMKELNLQKNLMKMKTKWKDIKFETILWKDTELMILTKLENIYCILDEHIIETLNMRGSVFVKPVEMEVKSWYLYLIRLQTTIEHWYLVQSNWLQLIPVFTSPPIINELPNESVWFEQVDSKVKEFLNDVNMIRTVVDIIENPNLNTTLNEVQKLLDQINYGINCFIDEKRLFFPRFYFLSNTELLRVLSFSKCIKNLIPFIQKCFENLSKIHIDDGVISRVSSKLNVELKLVKSITIKQFNVWELFFELEKQLCATVKEHIKQANRDQYFLSKIKWFEKWSQQIIIIISKINWTKECETCLVTDPKNSLPNYERDINQQLLEIVNYLQTDSVKNILKHTLVALYFEILHSRNVVTSLIQQNSEKLESFQWLIQCRYNLKSNDLFISVLQYEKVYQYEYMGNKSRSIHTPDTDRCHHTLLAAAQFQMFGCVNNFQISDRIEIFRDLAEIFGVQYVAYNCFSVLPYATLTRFIKGTVSSGAWLCLKNFNNCDFGMISVLAQYLMNIIESLRSNSEQVYLFNSIIQLKSSCYFGITNTIDRILPNNLKVLFRSYNFIKPDLNIICETLLAAYGFRQSKILSKKLTIFYNYCRDIFADKNYNFEMKNIQQNLIIIGKFKIDNNLTTIDSENALIFSGVLNTHVPQLTLNDSIRFKRVLNDFFPNKLENSFKNKIFRKTVDEILLEEIFDDISEEYICKLENLFWFIENYTEIVVTGDPFSGKTSALRILRKVYEKMEHTVDYNIVNSKTVKIKEIFEKDNEHSIFVQEGSICPQLCFENGKVYKKRWIIYDGPINNNLLNTLFSTLENRNQFCVPCTENGIKIWNIMETCNIASFSPNIISKCGIIYFNHINWRSVVKLWIKNVNPLWGSNKSELVIDLFNWIIPPCLNYIKNVKLLVFSGEINLIKSTITLVEMILNDACNENLDDIKYATSWIQAIFYLSFAVTISSLLEPTDHQKFDEFYRDLWKGQNNVYPQPTNLDKIDFQMPPSDVISIDYYYVFKIKGVWKLWSDSVRTPKIEDIDLDRMIVPTVDSIRQNYFLEMHLRSRTKFFLIGESGCGKTRYVENLFANKLPKNFQSVIVSLTRQMCCDGVKQLFLSKFPKLRMNQYGVTKDKMLISFIDDLNLSIKDDLDSPPVIELIRQYFDYGFWYNNKESEKILLLNIVFNCSAGFLGNCLPKICSRFLRHFNIYILPKISNQSLQKIFCCIMLNKLKSNGFPTDVLATVTTLVQATIDIYNGTLSEFKPTPNQNMYIFNFWDFEKTIRGCSLIKKETVTGKKVFAKLWLHEASRVFCDRLNQTKDKIRFKSLLIEIMENNFKETIETLFDTDQYDIDQNYFFQNEQKRYEECIDFDKTAQYHLEHYNSKNNLKLNIIFENYSLQNLSKICRILSFTSGCGLLIGVHGSGRKSLTRLAASIFDYDLFLLKNKMNYDLSDWRKDIKEVLLQVGGLGKKTVLLIEEHFLKNEQYYDDLNSLLLLGEVQNLYNTEEIQTVLEATRIAAQQGNRSKDVSVLEIMSFYVQRCQANLHIILCLPPTSKNLVQKLRLYPALLNKCIVTCFENWPSSVYEKIAEYFVSTLILPQELKDRLPNVCQIFNNTICNLSKKICATTNRVNYITSASYIDFIKCYEFLMNTKQKEITDTREKYQIGLDKLLFATEQVVLLANELASLKPQLIKMGERAAEMSKIIERETLAVEKASELVREEEKLANVQAAAAQSLKSECEADLALAIPILEDAIAALNTLKPTDITLVKSMKNPPDTIKLVMAAVCVIKEIKPDRLPDAATGKKIIDYWGPSKRILGEMNFLQQLKEFDKDDIPPNVIQKIRKEYLPNKDFQPHIVAKASSAAEGLCKWVIAMDLYDKVAKEVAPKKAKLVIAETKYAKTLSILTEKRRKLSELKERLESLNHQLAEANRDMKRVQNDVDNCTKRYQCAQKLVNSLEFEKSYWTETVNTLQNAYDYLPGDLLFSASIIAYMGQFSWKNREIIFKELKTHLTELEISFSEQFNFARLLKDKNAPSQEIINYTIRNIITDNKTIIQRTTRTCLLVDPQLQMFNWIQQIEAPNNLTVMKISDKELLSQLKLNAKLGRPILIRNIKLTLDMSLIPFLKRSLYEDDNHSFLCLNDSNIPFNNGFRLYLTTTLPNPQYNEEITHYLNIIYSPITKFSLTDQLLDILIAKENNQLYTKHTKILHILSNYKIQMKNIRYNILKTLSESKTNILDDESAIEILDNTKIELKKTQNEQKEANNELKNIETLLNCYKPIAIHGATIYKCLISLHCLNYMYQYSLNWYKHLFETTITKAPKSKNLNTRINNLIEYFTKTLFNNISRSLFADDTLIFSFLLYMHTMLLKKQINSNLIKLFITDQYPIMDTNSKPDWVSNEIWMKISYLITLEHFTRIKDIFNSSEFKDLIKKRDFNLNNDLIKSLPPFEKLLFIRIILPEKTIEYLKQTISDSLGKSFVSPPLYNVEKTYQTSIGSYVIVILTTSNIVNPIISLRRFSKKMGISKNFTIINFGTKIQTEHAEKLIMEKQKYEYWICIQNCHLAPEWMLQLENICENFSVHNTNINFRLWLITNADENFPTFILQNSVKVTIDTQENFKQILLSNYNSDLITNQSFYNQCAGNDKIFHKALYSLSYFDSVLRQRQRFRHIAWTSKTDFDNYDLQLSLKQLAIYIDYFHEIPFDLLNYLTICNYGSKTINKWDKRCIKTIFHDLFNEEVIHHDLYSFFNEQIEYRVPRKLQYFEVLKHIDNIPDIPPPEVYYLNQNDFIEQSLYDLNLFTDKIKMLKNWHFQPVITYVYLKDHVEILKGDLEKYDIETQLRETEAHTNLFDQMIFNELIYFQMVIKNIFDDLCSLNRVLNGDQITTPKLNEILECFKINSVPVCWNRLTPNISTNYLADYFQILSTNYDYLKVYLIKKTDFQLSSFFYPRKLFLTILLEYSQRRKLEFDKIWLNFHIDNSELKNELYSISGLHMVGARWNNIESSLEPLTNFKNIFDTMPSITIEPTSELTPENFRNNLYVCPIFKTILSNINLKHSNFVWQIELRTTKYSKSYWNKRNAYLICNL